MFELDNSWPNSERDKLVASVIGFYTQHNVLNNREHDFTVSGGGFLIGCDLASRILNDWQRFVNLTDQLSFIYKNCSPEKFVWVQDYLLSVVLPFYGKYYSDRSLSSKIVHPYKEFYKK